MQLLQFIIGIGIVIVLHELGHFLAARALKIEVEEFGIGFPPRAVKLFEWGGTIFSLNWIPLGGFVRPKGENDPSVPGGLAAASPWARLAVLFAGPVTNLLVAAILAIFLIDSIGIPNRVMIKEVMSGSPAATAGLQPGDYIVRMNEQEIESSTELINEIQASIGQRSQVVFRRGEQIQEVSLVPRDPSQTDQGAVGILMEQQYRPVSLLGAIPYGLNTAYEYARDVLLLPVRLLQGQASPEEGRLIGFKGMFDVYQQISNPLWFFMAISMSLGLFNLFPIPALDGGRILLTLPEIFLRRRIPPQYENIIHLVGFTVLLIFLIYINLQDFINPIQLP
jgi:regulator of sigma E protease